MKKIDNSSKKYMKIYKDSGCTLANYDTNEYDEGSIIVPFDNNEKSGKFRVIRKKGLE